MQTQREYLASKGLAKAGARGKFSRDAHAELARVRAEGMKFSDDPENLPVRVKRETKIDKPVSQPTSGTIGEPRMRYPLDQMFEGTRANGKRVKVNARQGCMRGRYSLAGCFDHAGQPHMVLVSSMEQIEVQPIGE